MSRIYFPLLLIFSTLLLRGESENAPLTFLPKNATIEGSIRVMHHPDRLGFWANKKDMIFFSAPSLDAGVYDVELKYAVGEDHGGRASIVVGDVEFKKVFLSTGSFVNPEKTVLGQIEHNGGPLHVRMRILRLEHKGRALLDFYSMKLIERQGN